VEAELLSEFPGSAVELVGGKGGIFEITMDDKIVYQKDKEVCNRFPEEGEIARLAREMK
jgi:predicted Rdx family selenoprotein